MITLFASYPSAAELLAAWDAELSRGGLLVRGASAVAAAAGSPCRLSIEVAGTPAVQVEGQLAAVVPGVGVAVMFVPVPPALTALAEQARSGTLPTAAPVPTAPAAPAPAAPATAAAPAASDAAEEPEEPAAPGSLFERLRGMSVAEKTQLALSGSRDERMALLRDPMKPVHIFVLKNPRVGLDEVQYGAKLASLSPDALKFIAEHRDWSANSQVCSALVRNPKLPVPLALRLLDRIPVSELKAIAKGGARDQIVQAARKRLADGR